MIGWLIALAVIILIGCIPLGISARYNENGPLLRLIAGPIRVLLFPKNKKEQNVKKAKEIKKTSKKKKTAGKQSEQKGGSIKDFKPLLRLILDFLEGFRRKLRVDRLYFKIVLAGGDPADLAINYGRAWTAIGNLYPQLERALVIKKRDVEVECDFVANETKILAQVDLTITIWRALSLGIWHGSRILINFLKILNERKGGAKDESKSS